ncbi:MAG: tRNA-intron lyase [Candidatus Woesearchaeota archaeon]
MINALIFENYVLTESSGDAKQLYDKSLYGTLLSNGQVKLSFIEALYLVESKKITLFQGKKELDFENTLKKAKSFEKTVLTRYAVYKDLREKGYLVKTALKFGADFRVYDKGIKPGEDHSKWIVYPVPENQLFSWYDFAAKNRVAHSTKKRLMLGIVDDENDVTYYEIKWARP